jgi:vacuolar-type H+-ATPase subunit E/Vma4
LEHLGVGQVQVQADEKTRKFFTDGVLDGISKENEATIQLGEPLEHGLGVIVETLDGHRQYDNTLETRLVRFRDTLRMSVYHLLMGEQL